MQECPYCKEEIKENAVICWHCRKRVKGLWLRRIIAAAVVLIVAVFLFSNQARLKSINFAAKQFVCDVSELLRTFADLVKTAPKNSIIGIKAMQEHKQIVEENLKRK